MTLPPRPADEERRLEALRRYQMLDTAPEQALDDLTELAAYVCDTPISMVSLVDEDRQWSKSRRGWQVEETPRAISFCGHAINETDVFTVPDARADERFADNPLVTEDPRVRFYAGVPLRTPDGHAVGTLCVLDREPRRLSDTQVQSLRTLGRQAMAQLELRRQHREASEQQRVLQEQAAAYRTLFDYAPIGILIADAQSNYLDANDAMGRMLGYSRRELIGLHASDIVAESEQSQIEPALGEIAARNVHHREWRFRRKDGTLMEGEVIATNMPDGHLLGLVRDITERRSAERALRESEEQLRLAVDAAQLGMFDWDIAGGQISWSRWHEKLWGYGPGEFDGTYEAFARRVHPEDLPRLNGEVEDCIRHHRRFVAEYRVVWPDGTTRWIAGSGEFSYDEAGAALRMHGAVRDVTERTQTEAELKLRTSAIEHSLHGFDIVNEQGKFVYANRAYLDLWGYESLEEILGTSPAGHCADPETPAHIIAKLKAHGQYALEFTARRKDGSTFEVLMATRLFHDAGGRELYTGDVIDITERKRADERIRRLNRTYAVLSDINQMIVRERERQVVLDQSCRIALEKGGFGLAWIGLVEEETGRLQRVAHAGGTSDAIGTLDRQLDYDPPECTYTATALKSGIRAVCNDLAEPSEAGPWSEVARQSGFGSMVSLPLVVDGRVVGIFNLYADAPGVFDDDELRLLDELALDIAFALAGFERERQRQQAVEQLQLSEERFRELAETIDEVFWMRDPNADRILYISPAYEKIWGRSRQSLYDDPASWLEGVHPDDRERLRVAAQAVRSGEARVDEYRVVQPDGAVRWVRDHSVPVREATGGLRRLVGTVDDITDRRELENQFREAQKLEAVGQLAGGIAHDFNNILAAMMMQIDLIRYYGTLRVEVEDLLTELRSAAERAANLTRQLLAFSRRQVMQTRAIDVNEVVNNLSRMVRRVLREDIAFQLNLHPAALPVRADIGMLDQVLLNLVVNARDAMESGGRLTLATSERYVNAREARKIPDAKAGRYAVVSVSDTGSGIPEEVLPHIFEPFFTTKEPGKGTGLGLATVFGIVKQHEGCVQVESEADRGTTFRILLPTDASGETSPVESAGTMSQRDRGSETILLVEDDPSVRRLTRLLLERSGYRVMEAANGAEALRLGEERTASIDLLLTDIVMPGNVNGIALAKRLQERKPELVVIFTSGYSAEIAGGEFELRENQNFIQKPTPPDELLAIVRRSLDA